LALMAPASKPGPDVEAAYRQCLRLARAHYENFPVASWLVPRGLRPHVAAIYAFARVADDIADEGHTPQECQLAQLAAWRARLHGDTAAAAHVHPDADAIFTALDDTRRRFGLDVRLLDDLLDAFAQDVTVTRYARWDDVIDYCRRSANPVGRLVLALAGAASPEALAQSDATCTALQLTNFWQDFGRDWRAGRLYVPQDVLAMHGADEAGIGTCPMPAAWQAVFRDVDARTAAFFEAGRDVASHVRGRLRYELRATWLGGSLIRRRTAEIRQSSFDARPTLTGVDALRIARDAILWR